MNCTWCLWYISFHKQFRNRLQSLKCNLTIPYFSFPPFECLSTDHSSDGLATQINAVLHAGSRATCHSFLNFPLCFSRPFRPGSALFRSDSVCLLVDNLYAEATEVVKLRAEVICILGEINSEARHWNRYQYVNLSSKRERFLVVIWSSKWKTIDRWFETTISETMISDSRTFLCTTIASTSPFAAEE
jgi:hypothetical protein